MIVGLAAGAGAVRLQEGIEELFDVDADLRLDHEYAVFGSLRSDRFHFEVSNVFHFIHHRISMKERHYKLMLFPHQDRDVLLDQQIMRY